MVFAGIVICGPPIAGLSASIQSTLLFLLQAEWVYNWAVLLVLASTTCKSLIARRATYFMTPPPPPTKPSQANLPPLYWQPIVVKYEDLRMHVQHTILIFFGFLIYGLFFYVLFLLDVNIKWLRPFDASVECQGFNSGGLATSNFYHMLMNLYGGPDPQMITNIVGTIVYVYIQAVIRKKEVPIVFLMVGVVVVLYTAIVEPVLGRLTVAQAIVNPLIGLVLSPVAIFFVRQFAWIYKTPATQSLDDIAVYQLMPVSPPHNVHEKRM